MSSDSTSGTTATAGAGVPAVRDADVDLVRTAALIRVIVFHATGNFVALTALPAMPVMFFLGGRYLARSVHRDRPLQVFERRARRVLIPAAVYVAVIVVVMSASGHGGHDALHSLGEALLPTNGGEGSGDSTADWLFSTLWYLRDYLVLAACSPLLLAALRRSRALTFTALAAAFVASTALGVGAASVLYAGFWTIGLSGIVPELIRRATPTLLRPVVVVGAVGGAALILADPDARTAPVGVAAAGLAWIVGLDHVAPTLRRVASGRRTASVVGWVTPRAVSVYVWQMVPVVIAFRLAGEHQRSLTHAAEALWVVPVAIAGTVLIAALVGPLERLAGSRRPMAPASDAPVPHRP